MINSIVAYCASHARAEMHRVSKWLPRISRVEAGHLALEWSVRERAMRKMPEGVCVRSHTIKGAWKVGLLRKLESYLEDV
jgi:hypothetical protein